MVPGCGGGGWTACLCLACQRFPRLAPCSRRLRVIPRDFRNAKDFSFTAMLRAFALVGQAVDSPGGRARD